MPLDHERLIVYQRAIEFVAWADDLIEETGLKGEIRNQLDRASISVPLNIAEGNGRFSVPDRIRFLDIAYGSSLECAACLDVAKAKRAVFEDRTTEGKAMIEEIVNRLVKLRESVGSRLKESGKTSYVRETDDNAWFSLCELETIN